VAFRNLEIDHVIPKSAEDDEVRTYTERLALCEGFTLESAENMVPTHHDCNLRKSDLRFSEGTLRYYLETWSKKQAAIRKELAKLEADATSSDLLGALTVQVERGLISPEEILAIVRSASAHPGEPREPWVITFGCNVQEIVEKGAVPPRAPEDYVHLCDWLEGRLLHDLGDRLSTVVIATEASHRDGEVLSVRVGAWHIDVEVLNSLEMLPWEVLELVRYSEVYDHSWQDHFVQAVVRTYHDVIRDDGEGLFGLRFCPKCGSGELEEAEAHDAAHDKLYCAIRCKCCDWSDWMG